MEPFINNNETNQESSQFCDTLINVTGAISNLRRQADCAIVLCCDGKTVSSRQCGTYPDVLRMLVVKMLNDDKFAELFTEASLIYSQRLCEPQPNTKTEDKEVQL